jgi:C_GCAxxG_C_C family probable redox protein
MVADTRREETQMDALALRERAEDLYRSGQFLCSEAIVFAFNEAMDSPMPREIVRLASGFPVGMGALGTGGCTCGALSGGVMVLGMVHGRSQPGEEAPLILDKARELHDWFLADKGSTCCRSLIRNLGFGSPAHIDQCVTFTGDVAEHLALMLDSEG